MLGLMLFAGFASLPVAVAVTVLLNLGVLLLSPWLNHRLYDVEWVSPERFRERSPASMATTEPVTEEESYSGFVHPGSFLGAGLALLLGLVVLAVPLLL